MPPRCAAPGVPEGHHEQRTILTPVIKRLPNVDCHYELRSILFRGVIILLRFPNSLPVVVHTLVPVGRFVVLADDADCRSDNQQPPFAAEPNLAERDRKSTRLNSSH